MLVALISPFRRERERARQLFAAVEFLEAYVKTSLAVAIGRDPKGLYVKAQRGEIEHFTGITSPYQPPRRPEIELETTTAGPGAAAERVLAELRARGILGPAGAD